MKWNLMDTLLPVEKGLLNHALYDNDIKHYIKVLVL